MTRPIPFSRRTAAHAEMQALRHVARNAQAQTAFPLEWCLLAAVVIGFLIGVSA